MNDLVGKQIGRLTVIRCDGKVGRVYRYLCKCECGIEKIMRRDTLKGKTTKSCGCLNRELSAKRFKEIRVGPKTLHGLSHTRLYKIWISMHYRCNNKIAHGYENYGGRGIRVCDEWNEFENFYSDMHESYKKYVAENGEKQTTLDRRNVDGNYSKDNCRWVNMSIQCRNRRITKLFTFNNVTTDLMSLCEMHGLKVETVRYRMKKGLTVEESINWRPHKKICLY